MQEIFFSQDDQGNAVVVLGNNGKLGVNTLQGKLVVLELTEATQLHQALGEWLLHQSLTEWTDSQTGA